MSSLAAAQAMFEDDVELPSFYRTVTNPAA
jgi:hypothetical protein